MDDVGSPTRTRTSNLAVNSRPLYRLSYRGTRPTRLTVCRMPDCRARRHPLLTGADQVGTSAAASAAQHPVSRRSNVRANRCGCRTRIRTLTKGFKVPCATVTPSGTWMGWVHHLRSRSVVGTGAAGRTSRPRAHLIRFAQRQHDATPPEGVSHRCFAGKRCTRASRYLSSQTEAS